ncbi:hypothetical protein Ndes2437B_g01965 [Nannochloris sp. 'desiccata']|nr:hypothetical protein KSW81_006984 [Chlorella desiccata (nom. nud.)]
MSVARNINIGEAPSASVHYLQGYSQPDGTIVLEASFRGRFMKGSEIFLPEGFSGAVLEKKEGSNGTEATTSYSATGTFDSFTYWNHDTAPVATDGIRRAMEWAALASHIHKPVDHKHVEAEVAKREAQGKDKEAK